MGMNVIMVYRSTIEQLTRLKEIEDHLLLEPIAPGKWSIREIIGHLYYWDKFILEQHAPFMSQDTTLTAFPDHDLHNNEAIQYIDKFETINSLIDEFVRTRLQLVEIINGIKSEAAFTIGSGKRQFTIERYISIFAKHDQHHLKQIKDKLPK